MLQSKVLKNTSKIALLYLFIGLFYIIFSDRMVNSITDDADVLSNIQSYKGVVFILVTSVFLFFIIFREFTKQYKLQQELIQINAHNINLLDEQNRAKAKLDLLLNTANVAISEVDKNGSLIYVNHAWENLFGYTKEEVLGKPSTLHLHPDEKDTSNYEKIKKGELNTYSQIRKYQNRQGETIWCELFVGANKVGADIRSLVGVFVDITERKTAEQKLIESKAKYQLLAENITDVVSLHGVDSTYQYISPSIKNVRGYEPDELIGKNPYDYIHPEDIEKITKQEYVDKLLQGVSFEVTYRFRSKDGTWGWFESNRQSILDEQGDILGIVSSSRDITDRVEKEQEIFNYQKSLQEMTIELSLVEEKQRKEIAANIHDHLSQSLVFAKMKLSDLIKQESLQKYSADMNIIQSHISQALDNSRKITYDLSPPILYELGLIETMYWQVEKIARENKLDATFNTNAETLNLNESELILIYRAIQEIINNTLKHANAKQVNIDFNISENNFQIQIEDDGVGFNANSMWKEKRTEGGFGLFNVQERVRSLEGEVHIDSGLGQGTKIQILLPFQQ